MFCEAKLKIFSFFYRGSEHHSNFKNQVVDLFIDGCGRRGSQLHSCQSVPVHHPDQYTGMCNSTGLPVINFVHHVVDHFLVMIAKRIVYVLGHLVGFNL